MEHELRMCVKIGQPVSTVCHLLSLQNMCSDLSKIGV